MPKKVHGRPAKAKSRPRRVPQATGGAAAQSAVLEGDVGDLTAAQPAATPVAPAASVGQPRRSGSMPAASRRTGRIAAPTMTINYHYLRRDIMALAVLAPAMIVLLVLAFVFLH